MIGSYTNQTIQVMPFLRNGPTGPVYGTTIDNVKVRYEPTIELVREKTEDSGNEVIQVGFMSSTTKITKNDQVIIPGEGQRVVIKSDPIPGLGGQIKFYEVYLE